MKLGAVFPQTEIGADPGGVREFAQAVQELGFDHLLAYDHVLGADDARHPDLVGPYRAEHMFHEILVLFGYLAGVAPGLELVTGVVITGQRQTALLAKQAAEIDVLTGGRFRLGLGIGWNPVEYEALGMNFHDRGRRLEEQIDLMRRLWTEPVIDYDGRWHKVTAAGINPLPVQRPIPIWIGGSAERALRRTALLADGYFPQRPLEGGWPATMQQMREWLEEAGRDWAVVRGRAADQRRRGNARRLAADGGRVARARGHSPVARDDGRWFRGCQRPHRAAARSEGGAHVIVPEPIERYAEEHTSPPEQLLVELEAETKATLAYPQMMAGAVQGRFLEFLVYSLGARRVLEIGTYSGYSALSMAEGLAPDGRIDTCEIDEQRAEVARRYIARSPYADRITVHLGPASRRSHASKASSTSSSSTPTRRATSTTTRPCCPDSPSEVSSPPTTRCPADARSTARGPRSSPSTSTSRSDERVVSVLLPFRDGVTLIRRRS